MSKEINTLKELARRMRAIQAAKNPPAVHAHTAALLKYIYERHPELLKHRILS